MIYLFTIILEKEYRYCLYDFEEYFLELNNNSEDINDWRCSITFK